VQAGAQVRDPADEVSLPFPPVLTGVGVAAARHQKMLEVEAIQLSIRDPLIEKTIKIPTDRRSRMRSRTFLEAASPSELASPTIEKNLKNVYYVTNFTIPSKMSNYRPDNGAESPHPHPCVGSCRVLAFDPELSPAGNRHITPWSMVPWEMASSRPLGEYVEVIDHDPASNLFFMPRWI